MSKNSKEMLEEMVQRGRAAEKKKKGGGGGGGAPLLWQRSFIYALTMEQKIFCQLVEPLNF